MKLLLGILAAFGASTLYSLGVALQAMAAKEVDHGHHLRVSLIKQLLVRSRWLVGAGMSILGWPLQLVALLLAPLAVVQPALAIGLLVLLVVGERLLHEHAGRRDRVAMLAIVLGVAGTGLTAPDRTTTHSDNLTLTLVLVGLGLLTLTPYLLRWAGRPVATVTMVGAGLGFAWSAVATKLAADDLSDHRFWPAVAWSLSTVGASVIGALSEMSAMQWRPAIQVAPVVFVTQTLVPVLLAPLLLGENFGATPLGGAPLVISMLVIAAGAATLARSPVLVALMAGEFGVPMSEDSGSTPRPSAASEATSRSVSAVDEAEPPSVSTTTSPARVRG
jgi:drug/metabolite transporter (DMT)-like permease